MLPHLLMFGVSGCLIDFIHRTAVHPDLQAGMRKNTQGNDSSETGPVYPDPVQSTGGEASDLCGSAGIWATIVTHTVREHLRQMISVWTHVNLAIGAIE